MSIKPVGFISRHLKIILPLFICLAAAGAVLFIIKTLNAPAEGTVSPITPTAQTITQDNYGAPGAYSGKYISFTYPKRFKPVTKQISSGYLEVAGFTATDRTSKEISVGVTKDTLDNSSGINYRRAHPELYREEPKLSNGLVFVSVKNGYERTAFIVHNDMMATISVLAPNGGDFKAESELVINSLKWR